MCILKAAALGALAGGVSALPFLLLPAGAGLLAVMGAGALGGGLAYGVNCLDGAEKDPSWKGLAASMAVGGVTAGVVKGIGDAVGGEPNESAAVDSNGVAKDPRLREDLGPEWFNEDGSLKWPDNNGAVGPEESTTLQPGAKIDRYGSPKGTFTSPSEASFSSRSLPYDASKVPYNSYEVVKPIDAMKGDAAPWFGQDGGATQYRTAKSVEDLINEGYLRKSP